MTTDHSTSAIDTGIEADAAQSEGTSRRRSRVSWRSSPLANVSGLLDASMEWCRREALLALFLASAFLIRYVLAGWNSYWLDELYSVAIYGVWNESAWEAVRTLAATSVHPPLYQFVLYNWMDWMSDSETATRALSNVYVTGAGLFLYLTLRPSLGRMLALLSAITFSLMSSMMQFGLEVRSYAQTLFLVSLSSYLILSMMRIGNRVGWRSTVVSARGGLLLVVNTALLLTHYYNAFFVVGQALMAYIFMLRSLRPKKWLLGTVSVATIYLIPAGVFTLTWGQTFLDHFTERADAYVVDDVTALQAPTSVLMDSIRINFTTPRVVAWLGLVLGVTVTAGAVRRILKCDGSGVRRERDWTTLYLVGWLALPPTVAYLVFAAASVARYSDRYFLYSVVPMAPLALILVERAWTWLRERRRRPMSKLWLTSILAIVILVEVIPGTIVAATMRKDDFRGTARQIVSIVNSQPDDVFVVLEPAFRETPVIDYYFERLGSEVRALGTIRRSQERAGGPFPFQRDPELLGEADFLILPFIHQRVSHFPAALEALTDRYQVHLWQIDSAGAGLVIFRITESA